MSQFIELSTNMGQTFVVLPNIAYFERPTNMSGFGGGGIGKFPIKLFLLGGQEYLCERADYDRLCGALDDREITAITVPAATKETVVVVHNAVAFNRYEDPGTSRTRIRGEVQKPARGVEIRMIDGQHIKAEPRDPQTDLYEVFKGVMENDGKR